MIIIFYKILHWRMERIKKKSKTMDFLLLISMLSVCSTEIRQCYQLRTQCTGRDRHFCQLKSKIVLGKIAIKIYFICE